MKKTILFALSLFCLSCIEKANVSLDYSADIVGKWNPTYFQQSKDKNGMWESWLQINTFAPLPQYEFTSQNKFLTNGKPGAACCFAGNSFNISNNAILFSEKLQCAGATCTDCNLWSIVEIKADTLILEQCNVRTKMVKVKS